jgi:NAD(P)-dependent dehydrogenase (short-subunit alcohol dehydrogenase family)
LEVGIVGVAVVTGSASGIGAAIRARLEARGDRVVGVDLRGAEVIADLGTPSGRRQAIDDVLVAVDDGIDRLVLCAGLGAHLDDFAAIASVNYFGAVDLMDGLLESMRGRPGSITTRRGRGRSWRRRTASWPTQGRSTRWLGRCGGGPRSGGKPACD